MTTDCPYCLRENDSHAPTGDEKDTPEPGDVSICWLCRNIGMFTEEGTVRKISPEEDAEIRKHQSITDTLMVLEKAAGPTQAADILRTAQAWETGKLNDHTAPPSTGEENV